VFNLEEFLDLSGPLDFDSSQCFTTMEAEQPPFNNAQSTSPLMPYFNLQDAYRVPGDVLMEDDSRGSSGDVHSEE
jgi:hypothetical protein